MADDVRVVVLAGGVGGSKLVRGLAGIVAPPNLTIVVNTGDDFDHLGLWISPDIDTVVHRMADVHDAVTGWGLRGDTHRVADAVVDMGGPDWFRLGDVDMATSLVRTHRRRQGVSLTTITHDLCAAHGLAHRVWPMTDDVVSTIVHTPTGPMAFQEWFVRHRHEPPVVRVEFRGAETARAHPDVVAAIAEAHVVVMAPSNPFLSLDPILAVPAIGAALAARDDGHPTIAVSPVVGGRALKGPTASLLAGFDLPVSWVGVAQHLADWIDAIVVADHDVDDTVPGSAAASTDAGSPAPTNAGSPAGVAVVTSPHLVMHDESIEQALARAVVAAAAGR